MGEASPLSVIFKALQSGIVHKYTLGRSGDDLSLGNCNVPYCTSVAASFEAIHVAFHFPWLGPTGWLFAYKLNHNTDTSSEPFEDDEKGGLQDSTLYMPNLDLLGMERAGRRDPQV